jgi:hypothetical protein
MGETLCIIARILKIDLLLGCGGADRSIKISSQGI